MEGLCHKLGVVEFEKHNGRCSTQCFWGMELCCIDLFETVSHKPSNFVDLLLSVAKMAEILHYYTRLLDILTESFNTLLVGLGDEVFPVFFV